METILPGKTLAVPPDTQTCPYCDAHLSVSFNAFELLDDGTWQASECELTCDTEPDLDDDDPLSLDRWDDWYSRHSHMPYVHWLPAEQAVMKWVNAHYRFEVHES
jgi:hypothetical protein